MRTLLAAAALLLLAGAPTYADGVLEACTRPKLDARPLPVFPVTLAPGTTLRAGPHARTSRMASPADGQSWLVMELCGQWALVAGRGDAMGYVLIRSVRPNGHPLDRSVFDRVFSTSGPVMARVWRLGSVAR